MSQLMQELEIRRAIGEIDELSAKTQERMAHATKLMANESVKYQAMLQTLGKRFDTEAFERVEEKKAVAQVQAARRPQLPRR